MLQYICAGTLKAVVPCELVERRGAGQAVGEDALVATSGLHALTAVAETPCSVFWLRAQVGLSPRACVTTETRHLHRLGQLGVCGFLDLGVIFVPLSAPACVLSVGA